MEWYRNLLSSRGSSTGYSEKRVYKDTIGGTVLFMWFAQTAIMPRPME